VFVCGLKESWSRGDRQDKLDKLDKPIPPDRVTNLKDFSIFPSDWPDFLAMRADGPARLTKIDFESLRQYEMSAFGLADIAIVADESASAVRCRHLRH